MEELEEETRIRDKQIAKENKRRNIYLQEIQNQHIFYNFNSSYTIKQLLKYHFDGEVEKGIELVDEKLEIQLKSSSKMVEDDINMSLPDDLSTFQNTMSENQISYLNMEIDNDLSLTFRRR
jgi:hypothetical protein